MSSRLDGAGMDRIRFAAAVKDYLQMHEYGIFELIDNHQTHPLDFMVIPASGTTEIQQHIGIVCKTKESPKYDDGHLLNDRNREELHTIQYNYNIRPLLFYELDDGRVMVNMRPTEKGAHSQAAVKPHDCLFKLGAIDPPKEWKAQL